MRLRDYISFKDMVIQACEGWVVHPCLMIENSSLFKKGRVHASPRGYYLEITRETLSKDLNREERNHYNKYIRTEQEYCDQYLDFVLKKISHPHIKIVRIYREMNWKTKEIDSIYSTSYITTRFKDVISIEEEYTVFFDDLSYLAMKMLSK